MPSRNLVLGRHAEATVPAPGAHSPGVGNSHRREQNWIKASFQAQEGGCLGPRTRLCLRERGQRKSPGRRGNRIDPEREVARIWGVPFGKTGPRRPWTSGSQSNTCFAPSPQPLVSSNHPGFVKTIWETPSRMCEAWSSLSWELGPRWSAREDTLERLDRTPLWRDTGEGCGPGALPARLPVGGGCNFSSWFSLSRQLCSPSPEWRLLGPETMCFLHAWEWKSAVWHRLAGSLHRLPLALYWQRR